MRIQFLKAHEEFKPGKFACIPDDSALVLIEAKIAKEAEPYVPDSEVTKEVSDKTVEPPAEKKK